MPRGKLSAEVRLRIAVTKLKEKTKKLETALTISEKQNREKDKIIEELRKKLEDKEAQRKELLGYLYKPKHPLREKKPLGKKPGEKAFHREKPKESEVTHHVRFPLTHCPICKSQVGEAAETVVRYEEDIDVAPRKIVRKYEITRHWCKNCETFVRSSQIPVFSRIGINALGYILYARYRLRLPFGKIQESLMDLHNFRISQGEISEKLQEAEKLFGKNYAAISEVMKEAKVVYADETGWRMNGENFWLWVFKTEQGIRYVIEESRGRGVAERALGEKSDRVIVSDGYAAYSKLAGENQQCWVHLLRAAKGASPNLYDDLVTAYRNLGIELTKKIHERSPPFFEAMLQKIAKKKYPEAPAQKVQKRLSRHLKNLLVCLHHENVLPENNTAERAIRPQVVMRKIFGGSRSLKGASAHAVNSSVLETARQQNPTLSFFQAIIPILEQRRKQLHKEKSKKYRSSDL
jgi:transposase